MSWPGDETPDTPPPDPFAAAERLTESMEGLRTDIRGLRTYGKRNRHLIWGLAVSLVLDVALSVAVAVIAVQASHAADIANSNRETQRLTCEAGNDSRAANRSLWDYIFDITEQANPNPPPEQQQQIAKLRDFVNDVFAPRDCAHLDTLPSIPASPPR